MNSNNPSETIVTPTAPSDSILLQRLYAATLLNQIGEFLLKEADLNTALEECAAVLAQQLGVAYARIWIKKGEILDLIADSGRMSPVERVRARIKVGQFNVGLVAQNRQPFLWNAGLSDPRPFDKGWARREGLIAFAACPLLVKDALKGVVALYGREPIGPETLGLLSDAARLIAFAIKPQNLESISSSMDLPIVTSERPPMYSEHVIITKTLDDIIIDWNLGARQLLGYDRTEILGQPCARILPPDQLADHRENLDRLRGGVEVSVPEATLIHQDGRRIAVRLTQTPWRERTGAVVGVVVVAHDLADAKRLQYHFQNAQKMEAFAELAGGFAHEFNNLLTVILGNSEVLQSQILPTKGVQTFLEGVYQSARRAAALTQQILAFSNKKPGQASVLDIEAAISRTEEMVGRLIGADVRVTTMFAFHLPPVKIDPLQLEQIIINLALNARDAMAGRGGELVIATALVTLDSTPSLAQTPLRPGNYVMFSLRDTGVGMSPSTRARLFEPDFTTKEVGKRTGMGLKAVADIVHAAAGHIEVESTLGEGSTFKIFLPVAEEPSVPVPATLPLALPAADMPHGSERILLVEDEEIVRTCTRRVLERLGYTVLEAPDGEAALHTLQYYDKPIDLVISDVVMPHLGGRRFAELLATLHQKIKVLFTSGYPIQIVLENGILPEAFAFLQKPHTQDTLARKVREVLDTANESTSATVHDGGSSADVTETWR